MVLLMNGTMLDHIEVAIQKTLDAFTEDERRWPNFYCPPGIARQMAKAGEVVFDACVETSQYQEKESA